MSQTPPRLLMALAVVGAGALTQLSAVIAMVSLPGGEIGGARLGLLSRIQVGTSLLDLGVLLVVPLAVLLARPVEPSPDASAHPVIRTVLIGASAVGASSVFLLCLRLVADLGAETRLLARPTSGALVHDLGLLLAAAAGAWWAVRELQSTPPALPAPAAPPDAAPAPPPGFPSGPPVAPPPPERPPAP